MDEIDAIDVEIESSNHIRNDDPIRIPIEGSRC